MTTSFTAEELYAVCRRALLDKPTFYQDAHYYSVPTGYGNVELTNYHSQPFPVDYRTIEPRKQTEKKREKHHRKLLEQRQACLTFGLAPTGKGDVAAVLRLSDLPATAMIRPYLMEMEGAPLLDPNQRAIFYSRTMQVITDFSIVPWLVEVYATLKAEPA